MAWVRIEDTVPEHRKHLAAGPAACWLWLCGIAYCQRQLSDGFIPETALPLLGVLKGAKGLAATLVHVGLFDRVTGGYLVHDYLSHNSTKEQALQRRSDQHAAKVKAGQAGSRARWQTNSRPIADAASNSIAPSQSHPIPSVLPTEALAGFEPFWATYPKHSGRKDCEAFWARLAPSETLAAKILRGATAYARHVADWKPKFIKAPIRWLEGAHWDDELGGSAPKNDTWTCQHAPTCADAWAHGRLVDAEGSGDLELVASVRRLNAKKAGAA